MKRNNSAVSRGAGTGTPLAPTSNALDFQSVSETRILYGRITGTMGTNGFGCPVTATAAGGFMVIMSAAARGS